MDVRRVRMRLRKEAGRELPVVLLVLPRPALAISSAPHGGGIGMRRWVLNAQVAGSYLRHDPDEHLRKLAVGLGLAGRGIGMCTAADVRQLHTGEDGGVSVLATVGLGHACRAAAPVSPAEAGAAPLVGTINLLVGVPARLSEAALVNLVATVTEAKAQALWDLGLDATGTPTDAVCVLCPAEGPAERFGGPRSPWGAPAARAVHAAVMAPGTDSSPVSRRRRAANGEPSLASQPR